MKKTASVMIAMIATMAAVPAFAAFDAISDQVVSSESITNNAGRAYELESIWFSPSAATSQSVTLSVIVGSVQYDQKILTVAGDTTWSANEVIIVPADAVLKIASDQASVTNDVYIQRTEVSSTRILVDGELADGEVDTAELAADAVTGAKIADDALDSEHYVDGSIDLAHMSAESVDSDQYVDGSVDPEHLVAALQDRIAYITVTGADLGAAGTGTITIQAKDAGGNDLAALCMVRTWIGTANDLGEDALTDYSVSTGTEVEENTANADYTVASDSSGTIVMAVDNGGAGTVYAWAEIGGRIVASGAVVLTAP